VVDPEIWNTIPNQQVHPSVFDANSCENTKDYEQSNIGDENKLGIASGENWANGAVVSIENLVSSNDCAVLISLGVVVTASKCLLLKPNVSECDLRFHAS